MGKEQQIKKPIRTRAFAYPKQTQPVACTKHCSYNCSYCRGLLLERMPGKESLSYSHKSYLITAGCNTKKNVLLDYKLIASLKNAGKRLNIHLCRIQAEDFKKLLSFLEPGIDTISLDLAYLAGSKSYDNEAIELASIAEKKGITVVPHIIIGLGREEEIIRVLKRAGLNSVVILVLCSFFKGINEPSLIYIEKALKAYSSSFSFIMLGCMRPFKRKKEIDRIALSYADVIVNPAKEIRDGLKWSNCSNIKFFYECCSFLVNKLKPQSQ